MSPPSHDAPVLHVRLPEPLLAAVDSLAQRTGTSRSDIARDLMRTALTLGGMWPPPIGNATQSR